MCGIAGLVAADRLHPDEPGRVERMRDVLTHRGPDEAGLHRDAHAVLAHRRLSIVDLSGGHQPLANEDDTIWVTFNGEIYNHAEIRRRLEGAGHRYRTRSDTETIVHAYEEWGDGCVQRFRGMFAFGIWDARRRRLLLVRDRLGIKPLYWTLARGDGTRGPRLLFASEIKSLIESGLVPVRARTAMLPEVLATRYTSGADTLFEGIYKLLPGHQLVYEGDRVDIRQYWDVPHEGADPDLARQPDAAVLEQFRALLEESVRLRLMADVPLGAFLSGGIDSSVITALMARATNQPVKTFSVAFEDRAFSELEYSREVAQAVGADRHEIVISDRDFFGALPRLVWFEDEPIAHPSSVPLHFVSVLARAHVKVVLTGEGSDELLAGYGKYPRALLNWHAGRFYERFVPAGARRLLASAIVPRLPARLERFASRSFLSVPHDPAAMFLDSFAGIPMRAQRTLLTPALLDGAQPYAASLAYFNTAERAPLLDRMLYTDMKTYLVELLMKQDQMSMSASIESRVPFLDHVLVEFAARLPQRFKLAGLTTKRILRDAAVGLVPPAILTRRKMGFPVPFDGWAAGAWNGVVRDVLLDRRSRQRGLVETSALEELLADHRAGRRRGGDALWALLNLELWYRTFIDRDGVQTLPAPSATSTGARVWQPAAVSSNQ
jgi:asparagine synthase (glutamine-hydrolysing)